jgi:sigma-B regulation protein RsbU (phosphoserine phosphatase)
MLFFLMGAAAGALVVFGLSMRAQARADRLETEKYQLTQEKQIVVDFMHHMVQALGEGVTRDELFQRIVHAAILCTGALSACIFEKRPDHKLQGVAVEGLFPPHRPLPPQANARLTTRARFIEQVLKSEVFDISEGIVGRVARTGRGELIADAAADPRIVKHDDPALAVRSVIAAPITFQDRMIGVLVVANSADGLPFNETDFSLVLSLAEQAGLAVHNLESLHFQMEKQQLDLDLALASSIQQMLLPAATPRIAGLDMAAQYVPAQKIGGDLYDFCLLGPARLGLAVADVSGKGIPASLLMAICRTNLQQIAPRHDSPAQVLIAVNRAMAGDVCRGMFITIIYAIVDVGKNLVTFARAGHELPLVLRRDSATGQPVDEFVGSEGMPLGLVDPEMFASVITDQTIPFGPGDTLVLYTDGITEAANAEGKEFSGNRLADALRTLRGRSAAEITDGILDHVRRFSGQDHHRDDLTLVTVKRVERA